MTKKSKIYIIIFIILGFGVFLTTHSPYFDYKNINNNVDNTYSGAIIQEKNQNTPINTTDTNTGITSTKKIIRKTPEIEKIEKEIIEIPTIETKQNNTLSFNITSINSNINNLIEVINFNNIEYIQIGNNVFKIINDGEKAYFGIESGTFETGTYEVFSIDKNKQKLKTGIVLSSIFDKSNINIANITPNTIKNDIDRYLVLQGNGFNKIISIQLNNNVILHKTTFEIISDNVVLIKIPKGLSTGVYYFNIMGVDTIYKLDKNIFKITN